MDTQKILVDSLHFFREHWISWFFSLAGIALGAWWGKRRARGEWSKKRFMDRINFSLTMIHEGKLQIRTLLEEESQVVFLNEIAVDRVKAACRHTTADNPILPVAKDERWFLLNAVLNKISQTFAEGFIKRDMGLPSHAVVYLICLTYENAGELRTRKVRAMVVQKNLLLNLPDDPPSFTRSHHSTRWNTLKQLAAAHQRDPADFLEVEICL